MTWHFPSRRNDGDIALPAGRPGRRPSLKCWKACRWWRAVASAS